MYEAKKYQTQVAYSPNILSEEQRLRIKEIRKELEEKLKPQMEALEQCNKITYKDLMIRINV